MNLALELLLSAAGMILGIVLIAEAVGRPKNSWENETDGPDGLDAGSGGLGIVFYLFSVYYHRKITGGREAGISTGLAKYHPVCLEIPA